MATMTQKHVMHHRGPIRRLLPLILLGAATPALAHDAAHPSSSLWNLDPLLLATLLLTATLYTLGLRRLWRAAGRGRGISQRQAAAFAASIALLLVALVSPIDGLSDQLNWVHMVQHMTIMMLAAPLFVLGSPALAALWALPLHARRRVGGVLRGAAAHRVRRYLLWQPVALWALFAFTLWVWHLPTLYEAALRHPRLHDLQHIAFFLSSCLFWRVLLDPLSRLRLSPALGVLYLFTTSLHATFLGVFMALAPRAWYRTYESTAPAWNLSAVEDQQLAGFIMWMPACMVYAIVAAVTFGLWLRAATHADPPPSV